jgi:quercetin dioxygenase-like cupin family protein
MNGTFRMANDLEGDRNAQDLAIRWICHPASTDAKQLTVVGATLAPGQGHAFHRHPAQEEVIYVLSGTVEQWVDRDMRVLGPGDACFIPAGMVHASFHAGAGDARILTIFGPSVGSGFDTIEMSGEAPWSTLRPVAVPA